MRIATGIEIDISSGNAAIVDGGQHGIAQLVRAIAEACEQRDYGKVRNINGNVVGEWCLLWTDEDELDGEEV